MEHLALYRQFRPMTFDEVVEQKHVVSTLRQSVASGQIAHAYLFSGTRGTGKTSVAKILSRAINCLDPVNGNPCNRCEICKGILDGSIMDVIEMDAASNNSVDNIRRVCDEVLFMPSRARYKVYIVDEVHMLSTGAFNALLKTLEEPPQHAVFILATTEPHRIPATIISRCQRYDFRRIPFESMVERLRLISERDGISVEDDALAEISRLSDGALRDAISLLDQVSTNASSVITRDDILRMTGVVDDRFLLSMAESILTGRSSAIIELCDQLVMDGRDILRFTLDLARYFRDLLVIGISNKPENLVWATAESMTDMKVLSDRTAKDSILGVITRLSELASELKWSPDMRTSFEIALLALGSQNAGTNVPHVFSPATSAPASHDSKPVLATPASPVSSPVPAAPEPVVPEPVMMQALSAAAQTGTSPEPFPESDWVAPPEDDPSENHMENLTWNHETIPGEDPAQWTIPFPPEPPEESPQPNDLDLSRIAPLTPNLTRATEPSPPVFRPATNLSKVASIPPVRSAKIPLPPVIPDDGSSARVQSVEAVITAAPLSSERPDRVDAAVSENKSARGANPFPNETSPASEMLSVSHLWNILIKRWEDTMLLESLQLRHARPELREPDLWLVFPDIMSQYIDELTQRNEYKKIREDTFALISGVREIHLVTDSGANIDAKTASSGGPAEPAKPVQPDWVSQIKAFADQNDIRIETVDDL